MTEPFRGGDQHRADPWPAPPHSPAQAAPLDVTCAMKTQPLDVVIALENVRNEQPPARPEHAPGLVNGDVAPPRSFDVMNGDVRDDDVEAVVCEGKRGDVGGLQNDAIRDTLRDRIPPSGCRRIARLISLVPDVHAYGVAGGQAPRAQQQHRAAAAAEIENALVSVQCE